MTASDVSQLQQQNNRFFKGLNEIEERLNALKERRTRMPDTDDIDSDIAAVQAELRRWCRRGLGGGTSSSSDATGSERTEDSEAADTTI